MLFGRKQRTINRLLIVEDEPLVAFDNEHALTDAGFHVVGTVDRVRDALTCLDKEPVDLVLSDVTLAGERSGSDLARELKPRGIRLLFVTASCPIDAPDFSIGCLAKPYTTRTLLLALDAVERVVAGRKPGRLPAGLSLYDGIRAASGA